MITPIWYRGETYDYTITVSVDGEVQSLASISAMEMQLKTGAGVADPALAVLSVGSGITLATQSGTTLGQAAIVIPYNWLTGGTTPAGIYYFDVCVIFPGPVRRYVVKPTKVYVRDVVNPP